MVTLLAQKMFNNLWLMTFKTAASKSVFFCVLPISVRPAAFLLNRTFFF